MHMPLVKDMDFNINSSKLSRNLCTCISCAADVVKSLCFSGMSLLVCCIIQYVVESSYLHLLCIVLDIGLSCAEHEGLCL